MVCIDSSPVRRQPGPATREADVEPPTQDTSESARNARAPFVTIRRIPADIPATSRAAALIPAVAGCTLAGRRRTDRRRDKEQLEMAATNINRVVMTGNLTRDPELRSTSGGTSVCSLRIATNTRRKDASGNWVDKPNYFDVTVWGAQGENCAQYLKKGRPVAIDGRLEWREWQGQQGNKRQTNQNIPDPRPVLRSPPGGDN